MGFYKYFLDGIPYYLARHYWWAYLWRPMAWFFDHQPIINTILFWQYRKLMQTTLDKLDSAAVGRLLQLTCVYGSLTPNLAKRAGTASKPEPLYIADASRLQLERAQRKVDSLSAARMNAEQLAYRDNSFDTVVVFFLLHEMPEEARRRVLAECTRIIAPGGRLLITEYGPLPKGHFLYRLAPARWLLTYLEPYLEGFWHEEKAALLAGYARNNNKELQHHSGSEIFSGFYRVDEYYLR